MRINVTKAADMDSLADLGMDEKICRKLRDTPVAELIEAARVDNWSWRHEVVEQIIDQTGIRGLRRFPKVNKDVALKLYAAFDQAGLLYHDPYAGTRALMYRVQALKRPETNEEYEAQIVIDDEMAEKIFEVCKALTPREVGILAMRFGLDGETPHMFPEIAPYYHVSQVRVRQIAENALTVLRSTSKPYRNQFMAILEGSSTH